MELITLDLFEAKHLASCFTKTCRACSVQKTMPWDASWLSLLEQSFPLRPEQTGTNGLVQVLLPARNAKQRGGRLMLNTSESPNVVVESSLSQVLEKTSIPARYFLSSAACLGILKRASKRGKQLPESLKQALINQVRSGELYGAKEIANAGKVLRTLREIVGEAAFEEWVRRASLLVQQKEILFLELCERSTKVEQALNPDRKSADKQTEGEGFDAEVQLRNLWKEWLHGGSPQRQESLEQLAGQLDSLMQELSHKATPTESFMLCLRCARKSQESLHEALSTIPQVRQIGQSTPNGSEECARGASERVFLGSEKSVTPTVVAGYGKCYNDLKDGGCLAVHTGYREGSFGQFVESELAGTTKASGGVIGGVRNLNNQVVGTLTACDLMKGSTNNQSISNGLLIVDENL